MLNCFKRDLRGTSAIEFAMIAPLFILVVLAMTAYGIYFGASHSVQQIAADTARAAIAGLDANERRDIAVSFIDRNAGGYPFISPERLTVEVGDSEANPEQFSVLLQYDARDLPIWALLEGMSLPSMTIRRRSTIRIGGV